MDNMKAINDKDEGVLYIVDATNDVVDEVVVSDSETDLEALQRAGYIVVRQANNWGDWEVRNG